MRRLISLALFSFLLVISHSQAFAQEEITTPTYRDDYYRGQVTKILDEHDTEVMGDHQITQKLLVEITEGPEKGKEVEIDQPVTSSQPDDLKFRIGDTVVVLRNQEFDQPLYYIMDQYRLPSLIWLFGVFFILTIIFAGWTGLTALIGLAFNLLVIVSYIIPQIIAGENPLVVSFIGGVGIALVSLYFAHGFNKRTSIALVGTLSTLVIALPLSMLFVGVSRLTGVGTEEAFFLQLGTLGNINLKGLLLGGIMIGVLGVLDDVTTAQSAAVEELKKANPRLGFGELYRRGLSIGKEHITSLINTLALAYVGASFPVLLIFHVSQQPVWAILNSEFIAEEIVRTLVGSVALILAVPITTALAAWYFGKQRNL
ncbi:MAG: YibE/F family protein [bacterium]|nr:YibE/F family protein [bacterium]